MKINLDDLQTNRLTASGVLCEKPCWVYLLIGNSYSQSESLIKIYDSRDTSGREVLDLSGSQYGSDIVPFNVPIYFSKGIYAEFSSNGYSVFAQFVPVY